MPESIKYLSGGEQTTINATITELFPAMAFNTGETPKTPEEMEKFVKNIDLNTGDVKESFVNRGNISAAEEYISSINRCLLYTSPSPRDRTRSRMPSSA